MFCLCCELVRECNKTTPAAAKQRSDKSHFSDNSSSSQNKGNNAKRSNEQIAQNSEPKRREDCASSLTGALEMLVQSVQSVQPKSGYYRLSVPSVCLLLLCLCECLHVIECSSTAFGCSKGDDGCHAGPGRKHSTGTKRSDEQHVQQRHVDFDKSWAT